MSKQRSIRAVARRETGADKKVRDNLAKKVGTPSLKTVDSFVNFAQRMGVGADNALTTSGYGFNPITRVRTTLEWIHRGSWLGGVAVDVVADDMTRAGVNVVGELQPEQMEKIEESVVSLQVWNKLNENIKWSRLYGGSIAVLLIEGQDMSTPLRLDTIGKGQFKGLLVLDRWMVEPSLSNLVTEMGPDLGNPKFYTITADAPALPRAKVHYTRCIRQVGVTLPYWQKLQENLWGISVLERLYDRMIAFDSATTGAAQLVYKSYLRTMKVKGLREIVAAGGPAYNGFVQYMELTRRFQNIEGITVLDGEDEFTADSHSAFSGLSDALTQFGQQLAGALQIPLVRLFGQSPAGFSTGDADLQMYYDSIMQQQNKDLKVGVTKVYRAIAQSNGIKPPDGFGVEFRSLWNLDDKEKAEIANTVVDAVTKAHESGMMSDKGAMQELRQSSKITGIFSNITEEDIESASEEIIPPPPPGSEEAEGLLGAQIGGNTSQKDPAQQSAKEQKETSQTPPDDKAPGKKTQGAKDTGINAVTQMKRIHDLDVVVENLKGSIRTGGEGENTWRAVMPADYGYVRKSKGADGDQVDIHIGDCYDSKDVWVIDQCHLETGKFDEHKCFAAFKDQMSAVGVYHSAYPDGRAADRLMAVHHISMDQFKQWLAGGDTTVPFVQFSA